MRTIFCQIYFCRMVSASGNIGQILVIYRSNVGMRLSANVIVMYGPVIFWHKKLNYYNMYIKMDNGYWQIVMNPEISDEDIPGCIILAAIHDTECVIDNLAKYKKITNHHLDGIYWDIITCNITEDRKVKYIMKLYNMFDNSYMRDTVYNIIHNYNDTYKYVTEHLIEDGDIYGYVVDIINDNPRLLTYKLLKVIVCSSNLYLPLTRKYPNSSLDGFTKLISNIIIHNIDIYIKLLDFGWSPLAIVNIPVANFTEAAVIQIVTNMNISHNTGIEYATNKYYTFATNMIKCYGQLTGTEYTHHTRTIICHAPLDLLCIIYNNPYILLQPAITLMQTEYIRKKLNISAEY